MLFYFAANIYRLSSTYCKQPEYPTTVNAGVYCIAQSVVVMLTTVSQPSKAAFDLTPSELCNSSACDRCTMNFTITFIRFREKAYAYSALYAIAYPSVRLSVRPSVSRVDQPKKHLKLAL